MKIIRYQMDLFRIRSKFSSNVLNEFNLRNFPTCNQGITLLDDFSENNVTQNCNQKRYLFLQNQYLVQKEGKRVQIKKIIFLPMHMMKDLKN